MDNDDRPVGRVLSRREVLALFGAAGAALLVGCGPDAPEAAQPTREVALAPTDTPAFNAEAETSVALEAAESPNETAAPAAGAPVPSCIARPEQAEGPYFVDTQLNRSDIRVEPSGGSVKAGVPLALTFNVARIAANACTPLAGAIVDIWQCDALGVYSGVMDRGQGGDTTGQKFLRGYQVTDAQGAARFVTIYPGWYPGRTVHIHFKIRTDPNAAQGSEFVSQLYFDDTLSDQVHTQAPYAERGQRNTTNNGDGLFRRGGEQLLLQCVPDGQGYAATFAIGLQM